jgi:hypothetical protein
MFLSKPNAPMGSSEDASHVDSGASSRLRAIFGRDMKERARRNKDRSHDRCDRRLHRKV